MPAGAPSATPTRFLDSDRRLARAVQPLIRFLHVEAAGAVLLLGAALVALVWANSPWRASYTSLWSTQVTIDIGGHRLTEDLTHVVNDMLMTLFFFVVGMEIKREVVHGELRDPRAAALPAAAALGGMIAPAAIYLAFTAGGPGAHGWGVPIATDIAFALGVVALLGSRLPPAVKVLLLALAIVDDIGGIVVIAAFYSESISPAWLVVAAALVAAMAVLHHWRVTYLPVFVLLGVALWLAVHASGVHATIAGVAMGLLMPARARLAPSDRRDVLQGLADRQDPGGDDVRAAAMAVRASVSDCDRAITALHPWSSYVVVPLFALANAGVELTGDVFRSPSSTFLGVVVGLVAGKLIGVTAFAWCAVRTGLARLPDGVGWGHVVGVAAVAGTGFTVALFIADASFAGELLGQAKVGVLTASVTAAILGLVILRRVVATSSSDELRS